MVTGPFGQNGMPVPGHVGMTYLAPGPEVDTETATIPFPCMEVTTVPVLMETKVVILLEDTLDLKFAMIIHVQVSDF